MLHKDFSVRVDEPQSLLLDLGGSPLVSEKLASKSLDKPPRRIQYLTCVCKNLGGHPVGLKEVGSESLDDKEFSR